MSYLCYFVTGPKAYNPVSFEKWFLVCLRKCEKKGAEFTFLCPGLVRISWHDKVPVLRQLQTSKGNIKMTTFQSFNSFFFRKWYMFAPLQNIREVNQ